MKTIDETASAGMQWYVVKVQSNREKTISEALRRRIARDGAEALFGQVLVPVEKRAENTSGKTRVVEHKLFPGYILIQMILNDDTWFMVRDTSGVGDFTGPAGTPAIMSEAEIDAILSRQSVASPAMIKKQSSFNTGDTVTIKDGAFAGFNGVVESIDSSGDKISVLIEIFGRPTPVVLECWQLAKE